jgi:hypothetical protein
MSAEQVAHEFAQYYYGTREGNPQGIGALYVSQDLDSICPLTHVLSSKPNLSSPLKGQDSKALMQLLRS